MKRFLLAIPVFNERTHLPGVLQQVRCYGPDVLVVDDGSTDGTAQYIESTKGIASITHAHNRGYGQAIISAFDYAIQCGYEWLITMDCDEQHEPGFIPDFVCATMSDRYDIISGSRYLTDFENNGRAPEDRRRINRTITYLLNSFLDLALTDSFCGFKAYRVDALQRLTLNVSGYAFPLQFWVQAVHRGLRIGELGVSLIYNDPNRHFGGDLDNPDARLAHYLEVFLHELNSTGLAGRCLLRTSRQPTELSPC